MKKTGGGKRLRGMASLLAGTVLLLLFRSGMYCLAAEAVTAVACADFLDSIGTLSAISVRGESLQGTIASAKYLGVRWLRAGIEGDVPIDHFIQLHQQVGLRFSWGLGSGGTNLAKLIETGRKIAQAGALLAFEGPNEPNNWGFTYRGQAGGGNKSWMPVAQLQKDLYAAVKSDPLLSKYPVWSISEGGAETDNVGLQFLTIPQGADTLMPAGTRYADYANVHNYIYHPNASGLEDNKTWKAADPTSSCKVDGLYVEYGLTWARRFTGYSDAELKTLPRVTTETGTSIGGEISEEIHALNLLSMYLDQFKRDWSYTAVYLLRDRVDEGGNQQFGFFKPDYSPRKAAVYLHNLTTILTDKARLQPPGKLSYSIPARPETTHELLLQKDDHTFELVVWNEQLKGSRNLTVKLAVTWPAVNLFDPTVGIAPSRTLTNISSVELKLSDHPLIIEVRDDSTTRSR